MSWGSLKVRLLLCCVATRAFNIETTGAPAAEPLVGTHEYARLLSVRYHLSVCCNLVAVTLTGAALSSIQSIRTGAYTVVAGQTQDGRAVYQQQGGSEYLFYWSANSDWHVGPDYATGASGLGSSSNLASQCPEDAGTWVYWTGSEWGSGGVDVTCILSP